MRQRIALVALLFCLVLSYASAQSAASLSGRVIDSASKQGLPNLQVKLKPPANSPHPVVIGSTDTTGSFSFNHIAAGRYLLEVSQGPYVLYRQEVDPAQSNTLVIPLQHR